MVEHFHKLDTDGSGKLDAEEARAGLKEISATSGRALGDREIDFFIKTTAGEDGQIHVGEFASLLFRLKVYNEKKK